MATRTLEYRAAYGAASRKGCLPQRLGWGGAEALAAVDAAGGLAISAVHACVGEAIAATVGIWAIDQP